MNINTSYNISYNPIKFHGSEIKPDKPSEDSGKIILAEFDSVHGFLKLSASLKETLDSQRTYYINKDGSGRKLTSWGVKDFPVDTFSDVLKHAGQIVSEKRTTIFEQSDKETLLDEIWEAEEIAREKDKKNSENL